MSEEWTKGDEELIESFENAGVHEILKLGNRYEQLGDYIGPREVYDNGRKGIRYYFRNMGLEVEFTAREVLNKI